MLKKSHGPAFRKELIPLKACPSCQGQAVIKGLFHHLDCLDCNASGWVREDNGQALELQDLVTQLSFNLRRAFGVVEELRRPASAHQGDPIGLFYSQNNRRGAGGSNYTGD
jgi:hypothetical protein